MSATFKTLLASAQELHNASTLDKKVEVKLTDIFTSTTDAFTNAHKMDDTKLKFNVASATFDESTTSAQSVTNVASSITSGKNVTLDSSDDIAIKGSDITARDTIDLKSKTGNISITESVDTTNTQSSEKHASAEVNLVVQNEFVETAVAVDNAIKAAEQLKQTKEDYSNYKRELKKLEASLETLKTDPQVSENDISNLQALITVTKDDEAYYIAAIAAATVNLASKTVAVAQQANAAGASTATAGFSAGLSLDIQGSKTSTDTTATKSNASNLTASNINIATDKTTDTSVTVSGSNVNASDILNIDTHDLNVIASTDTASTNSSSKDISGSVSMTVYGAASGPQVSLGYGQNESRSNSTTYTNSTLTGNTLSLNATNDVTLKGATVRADDTLNVNVGNNLTVASVQDTSSSTNHGFNISGGFGLGNDPAYSNSDKAAQGALNQTVGLRTGNGTVESVNGGIGASNGRSYDTQTVLTSLTGDSVNVTTGSNTKLSGAVIAATDAQGNDTGKLNLTTNTLTTENLTDTHYNSATGFSIGANIGLTPATKDPKPDTKNTEDKTTEDKTTTTINSPRLAFNTSTDTSVGKTLATVGEGTITITDPRHSVLDTESKETLNRDVTKVDKELYSSSTGTKVDATIDNRMFTKKGQEEIAEDFEKTKELYNTLSDKAGKFLAKADDYINDTKLNETKKAEILAVGAKETFDDTLAKSGLTEDQIKEFQNSSDYKRVFGIKDDSSNTTVNISNDSNPNIMTLEKIPLDQYSNRTDSEITAMKASEYLESGANLINKLVDTVGSDNATYAIYSVQIAVEGPVRAGLSIVGDAINEELMGEARQKASTYIAEEGLDAKSAETLAEEKAIYNLSSVGVDLGSSFLIGGAASITRGAEKVADASQELNKIADGGNSGSFASIYDKASDAKAEIDTLADTIASKYDGTVAKAPIKTEERAQQKINSDYDGDATQIKDLARNTIIVDSSKIDSVVADLTSNGANVKTISSTTDELGYSGINATIQTKTGITAEVQVNTPEMIFAKESETNARKLLGDEAYNQIAAKTPVQGGLGHTLYEEWRVIPNKNSEAAKVLAEKSRQYYNTVRSANAD